MITSSKMLSVRNLLIPIVVCGILAASVVLSSPTRKSRQGRSRSIDTGANRQPKTLNMTMGMVKDILQNGVPFRPVPPPFPGLKNLFKVNGTQWTWVPLGSLLFSNNGKIIGG